MAYLNCTFYFILSHYLHGYDISIYLICIVLFRMWNLISFDLLHLDNLEHCWNLILIFSHWILSLVGILLNNCTFVVLKYSFSTLDWKKYYPWPWDHILHFIVQDNDILQSLFFIFRLSNWISSAKKHI